MQFEKQPFCDLMMPGNKMIYCYSNAAAADKKKSVTPTNYLFLV